MRDDFAVFILSHGRADRVHTISALERGGYTGRWYIIIDNEDDQGPEYIRRYGDRVIVFDRTKPADFDVGDNTGDRRVVIYARNECHRIAAELGLTYFLELDDDYASFSYRWAEGASLRSRVITRRLDDVFAAMLDFLDVSGALTVCFSQGGDTLGGVRDWRAGVKRKAMNSFFCRTDRPFKFVGRINEDVCTPLMLGQQGHLFLTVFDVCIVQKETQSNAGGMTDVYLDAGTYLKSFYSVMYRPDCVKVYALNTKFSRLHHLINWKTAVPKLISSRWRKPDPASAAPAH